MKTKKNFKSKKKKIFLNFFLFGNISEEYMFQNINNFHTGITNSFIIGVFSTHTKKNKIQSTLPQSSPKTEFKHTPESKKRQVN